MRGLAYSSFPIVRMRNEDNDFTVEIFTLEILGRYPSGQRGQTVNLLPSASKVESLPAHQAELARPEALPIFADWMNTSQGGRSSAVESQPSKLAVVGSTPTARSNEVVLPNSVSFNVKVDTDV